MPVAVGGQSMGEAAATLAGPRLKADAVVEAVYASLRLVAITGLQAPLFVPGRRGDRHAHPDGAYALYDAAPSPKALWLAGRAAHRDLYRVAPDAYRTRVLGVFRHLDAGSRSASSR